jgi:branched-chain amino acid transport system substrate-binding protein
MIQKNRFRSLLVSALAAVSMVAAGKVSAQEITLMSIAAMTGSAGFAGAPEQKGIRLAIEEANKNGYLGGARIKLIEGDYASDKAQAIDLANQAIKRDHVLLSLGPTTSPDGIAVGYVFNEAKTPMISFATSNQITTSGPWVFRIQQGGGETVPALAKYAYNKAQVHSVALIYDGANDGLIESKKMFGDAIKAEGGSVVADEAVSSKETNFLPLATKLAGMDLDGIYFSTYAEQAANIMIQLRQAGLPANVRFLGAQGVSTPRLMQIGGTAVEGTLVTGEYVPGLDSQLNKAFEAAYRARYNSDADFFAAIGYSMGLVALQAIKEAGPHADQQKVRDALDKIHDVPVVVGSGLWNHKDRNGNYGAVVLTVKNGKFAVAQ